MKEARCPKCNSKITAWQGGIAICTTGERYSVTQPGNAAPCNWRGNYPRYVDVLVLKQNEAKS